MESGRVVTGESGVCLPGLFLGGGGGGSPGRRTPPPSGAWAAFVAHRIPEIVMLAHPEWIPAVPWALANWVRGSFKLTGNPETKEQAVPEDKCFNCSVKVPWHRRVCGAGAQVRKIFMPE